MFATCWCFGRGSLLLTLYLIFRVDVCKHVGFILPLILASKIIEKSMMGRSSFFNRFVVDFECQNEQQNSPRTFKKRSKKSSKNVQPRNSSVECPWKIKNLFSEVFRSQGGVQAVLWRDMLGGFGVCVGPSWGKCCLDFWL